jgi:ABC-type polysaccharide/polyol phosphate transport system ATPase subunit
MTVVRIEHVSKRFTLHHERPRSLQELFLNVLRLKRTPSKEEYWALHDVSLEIHEGEMVGIIGENGAGKSTLLKLLSHIIEPSSGQITVEGRLSALLELGAGFHPDLTGRENIYLNGSIIGLSKARIDRIFDNIVGFAEMERFIDIPVKHYSSGMYMRLGFSIAVHVEPDILLVDEVLAVGDQSFQIRCLDRIQEMKRQGVSIVLVTHNLDAVRTMCSRAVWLDEGQVQAEGAVDRVLEQYLAQVYAEDEQSLLQADSAQRATRPPVRRAAGPNGGGPGDSQDALWRWGTREGEIVAVELLDGRGEERRVFRTGETFVVRIHFDAHKRIEQPQFGLALYHASGFHLSGPNTVFSGLDIEAIEGQGYVEYVIERLPLLEGTYLLSVSLYDHEGVHAYDFHHQAYTFRVRPSTAIRERYGTFFIPADWRMGPAVEEPAR